MAATAVAGQIPVPSSGPHLTVSPVRVDAAGAIEKVEHHLRSANGGLVAVDPAYRLFLGKGVGLALGGPVFRLRLDTVRADGAGIPLRMRPWRGHENTASRRLGSGLAERVVAQNGRLEWQVVISHRLAPAGAVTLTASVSGGTRLAPARSALRWSVGGGRVVSVGALAVKNARGQVLYRARPLGGSRTVTLQIPARIFRGAAYPLTVDPVISPEHSASTPAYGAPFESETLPSLAWDGSRYLLVWQGASSEVEATRVGADGTILDPAGITVAESSSAGAGPSVASNGSEFLVTWPVARSSGNWDVEAARISSGGALLDSTPIAITSGPSEQDYPAVASDGTKFLVAWSDQRSGTARIYGMRVGADGSKLESATEGFPIATNTSYFQYDPSLAWNGSRYLVAWDELNDYPHFDIYGRRIAPDGTSPDTTEFPISTATDSQTHPSVASNGAGWAVAWQDDRNSATSGLDIYGVGITADASVSATETAICTDTGDQTRPRLATYVGGDFLAVWEDDRNSATSGTDVYARHLNAIGSTVSGADPFAVSAANGDQGGPVAATDGTTFLVAWSDQRVGSEPLIYGARVKAGDWLVQDADGKQLTSAAQSQSAGGIASDGTGYLVVFEQPSSSTGYDVYGARLTAAGTALDGSGFKISTSGKAAHPSVAWNGSSYLVVWEDGPYGSADIHGARVSSSGTVLDPGGIPISSAPAAQLAPDVVWNGSQYLVVWSDDRNVGTNGADVYGARVQANGTVLDPSGLQVDTEPSDQWVPRLAWNGSEYLLAWADDRSTTPTVEQDDAYARRLSASGAPIGSVFALSATTASEDYVTVASDGSAFLATWTRYESDSTVRTERVTRIGADGSVSTPGGSVITTGSTHLGANSVVWSAPFYVVAWENGRVSKDGIDVYAARVDAAGSIVDAGGFTLASGPGRDNAPMLAAGPNKRVALAYGRDAPESPYRNRRHTFVRFLDGGALVMTGAADHIDRTSANLHGTVNPQGDPTSFAFEYGLTTGYGSSTTAASAGTGTSAAPVSGSLAGLAPGTTYHYRLNATNRYGTVHGADRTFTTAPAAPPPPPPRCVVPKVVRKKLAAAKTAIRRAHCRTGRVRKAYSKRVKKGRVISQSPKPGKNLADGGKVNLVVSKGRRHRR